MPFLLHICKRYDRTHTLCDLGSARVAAVDFSQRPQVQPQHVSSLCGVCEKAYAKITEQARRSD
jgi:hypothetical protein